MSSVTLIRLAVTLFFLIFVWLTTIIKYLNFKEYSKNEKLKNLPFLKPAWAIIIGILLSLTIIYFFLLQPGLPK